MPDRSFSDCLTGYHGAEPAESRGRVAKAHEKATPLGVSPLQPEGRATRWWTQFWNPWIEGVRNHAIRIVTGTFRTHCISSCPISIVIREKSRATAGSIQRIAPRLSTQTARLSSLPHLR